MIQKIAGIALMAGCSIYYLWPMVRARLPTVKKARPKIDIRPDKNFAEEVLTRLWVCRFAEPLQQIEYLSAGLDPDEIIQKEYLRSNQGKESSIMVPDADKVEE